MRQIGEGALQIPEEWHNATVNIFTSSPPGMKGLSLTINRDQIAYGASLEDYTTEQSGKLKDQLKNYQLLNQAAVTVDGQAGYLMEFTWFSSDVGEVHQVLLTLVHGQTAINFAGTCAGKMTDEQRKSLIAMLLSFRFNTPCVTTDLQ